MDTTEATAHQPPSMSPLEVDELLLLIFQHIQREPTQVTLEQRKTREDLHISLVCKRWRKVASHPSVHVPWRELTLRMHQILLKQSETDLDEELRTVFENARRADYLQAFLMYGTIEEYGCSSKLEKKLVELKERVNLRWSLLVERFWDPAVAKLHWARGNLEEANKHFTLALKQVERLRSLNEEQNLYRREIDILTSAAKMHVHFGSVTEAIALYKQASNCRPELTENNEDTPAVQALLGICFGHLCRTAKTEEDYAAAKCFMDEALQEEPPRVLQTYVEWYLFQKQLQPLLKFLDAMRGRMRHESDKRNLEYQRIYAKVMLGDMKEAMQEYTIWFTEEYSSAPPCGMGFTTVVHERKKREAAGKEEEIEYHRPKWRFDSDHLRNGLMCLANTPLNANVCIDWQGGRTWIRTHGAKDNTVIGDDEQPIHIVKQGSGVLNCPFTWATPTIPGLLLSQEDGHFLGPSLKLGGLFGADVVNQFVTNQGNRVVILAMDSSVFYYGPLAKKELASDAEFLYGIKPIQLEDRIKEAIKDHPQGKRAAQSDLEISGFHAHGIHTAFQFLFRASDLFGLVFIEIDEEDPSEVVALRFVLSPYGRCALTATERGILSVNANTGSTILYPWEAGPEAKDQVSIPKTAVLLHKAGKYYGLQTGVSSKTKSRWVAVVRFADDNPTALEDNRYERCYDLLGQANLDPTDDLVAVRIGIWELQELVSSFDKEHILVLTKRSMILLDLDLRPVLVKTLNLDGDTWLFSHVCGRTEEHLMVRLADRLFLFDKKKRSLLWEDGLPFGARVPRGGILFTPQWIVVLAHHWHEYTELYKLSYDGTLHTVVPYLGPDPTGLSWDESRNEVYFGDNRGCVYCVDL